MTLDYNYRIKNGDKKLKTLDVDDFIDIKGWKAIGNKIPDQYRLSAFKFFDNTKDDRIDLNQHTSDNQDAITESQINNNDNENDELTLFKKGNK